MLFIKRVIMNKKILNVPLLIWISFFLSIFIFKFFPSIDIFISSLFFKDGIFFLQHTFMEQFFYQSIKYILAVISLGSLGIFGYNILWKKNLFSLTKRKMLYIILVLTLVPGAVVQFGFKEQFERPRPRNVIEFHGKKPFAPAYTFTNENGKSFVSGHTAAATSLLGIVLLIKKWQKIWLVLTYLYIFGIMVARIAAGGHFFSDVITSFFLVYIANQILYKYLIENEEKAK